MENNITVEVVLSLPEKQYLRQITLYHNATLQDAIFKSNFADEFPEIINMQLFGIFGKRATPNTPLKNGDRVEIYRPLITDPKTARRRRVQQI
ncbi:MAG: RnfH family protein [Neisseriaceae bacterium]|nr:RnfH family protein [Neisseriaceae bacterium]